MWLKVIHVYLKRANKFCTQSWLKWLSLVNTSCVRSVASCASCESWTLYPLFHTDLFSLSYVSITPKFIGINLISYFYQAINVFSSFCDLQMKRLLSRTFDCLSGGHGHDPLFGCSLPTGWVGVSIMYQAKAQDLLGPDCRRKKKTKLTINTHRI